MLYIKYINPTGLFSYSRTNNIVFPDNKIVHLVGINEDKDGCSNAAGKSSLFNALCEVLFGENPSGANGSGALNVVWGNGCCARVEFIISNIHYRITYVRGWNEEYYPVDNNNNISYKSKGPALFLDRYDGGWIDERESSIKDTRTKVIDILGITYERFLALSYMSPRVSNKFLRGTNKDKIDILSGITGVDKWDKVLDIFRKKRNYLKSDIESKDKSISFKEGELNVILNNFKELDSVNWHESIVKHESRIASLSKDLDKEINNRDLLCKEVEILEKDLQTLSNSSEFINVNKEINRLKLELSAVYNCRINVDDKKLNAINKKLESLSSECNIIKGKLEAFNSGIGKVKDLDICPMCESEITKEKKEELHSRIINLKKDLKDITEKYNKKNESLKEEKLRLDNLSKKVVKDNDKKINLINGEIETFTKQHEKTSKLIHKNRSKIDELSKDIKVLEDSFRDYKGQIDLSNNAIEAAKSNISKLENLKEDLNKRKKELSLLNEDKNKISDDIYIYEWVIGNIPFIKLHKLSASIINLVNYVNGYLNSAGDTALIDIKAFEEKKNKKDKAFLSDILKSDIAVSIIDGGKVIDPKLCSEGEVGRFSNAINRAIHDIAGEYGCGCNIQILDEIFSYMDEENSQKLAGNFNNMSCQGTIIITDNSGKASNLINFDETWIARKREGNTTLEV